MGAWLSAAVDGVLQAGGSSADQPVAARLFAVRLRRLATQKSSYALADQVVFSLGNLVVAALLSRHVATREFGIYILTQRSLDVVVQLCNVFCWAPFVYNLPGRDVERARVYLGSLYLQQIVACVLIALAFLLCAQWAATPSRGLYYGTFAPLVPTAAGIVFREFTRRMYFAQMRFRAAFWTDVVTNAVQAAGVYGLWRMGRLTVSSTLWMLSGGAMLVSAYWLVTEWSSFSVDGRSCWRDLTLNLKLGRWFFGSNMLLTVSAQANLWILSGWLGGASVVAYAICEGVVNIPRVALTSLQNMMAPTMARAYAEGGKPELNRMVRRIDLVLMLGSSVCAVAIVLVGPWLAMLIYKHVPGNSRLVLITLALNLVLFSTSLARTYGLSAMDRAGLAFYATAVGVVAQLLVCGWLVRHAGVPGAAAALLLGTTVIAAARWVFYGSAMKQQAPQAESAEAVQPA